MLLDIGLYDHGFIQFTSYCSDKKDVDVVHTITVFAAFTGIPIVAVSYFAESVYGLTPEIKKLRDNIIDFYGYTDIIGIEAYVGEKEE